MSSWLHPAPAAPACGPGPNVAGSATPGTRRIISDLSGRTIAFVVDNSGVEEPEPTTPWAALPKAGKPVAAICHAPWALVEAGVLSGKTLPSHPSPRTDVRNAGGSWVDEQAKTCPAHGWTLVTSRTPTTSTPSAPPPREAFAG